MSQEVLDRHWSELRAMKHVLNVYLGEKHKGGVNTGTLALVILVDDKVPEVALSPEDIVPKTIEGVPTDVQSLKNPDWQAGETEISKLHPMEQRRRLGFRPGELPKAIRAVYQNLKVPSGKADWTAWANDIQDQMNCGSCLVFDYIGVWETLTAIAAGNIKALIKLSESHLWDCTPNATCDNGSTPDDVIAAAVKGVCLEVDCPYQPVDEPCGSRLAPNWWLRAKKLAGQNAISDPNTILSFLDLGPLVATFQVPQSFFNYVGGIYKSLGPQDPIVGGHGVGCFGYDTSIFRIMRNQWKGWGQNCVINGVARPGWFMIDPSLLDPEMYQLILSNDPVPAPSNPNPSPHKSCILTLPSWINRKKK